MKVRSDIIRMYKEVHGWVGIISGLALFIAFFAGALTMFEAPLARWAAAPTTLAPPPALADTPRLVEAVLEAHPEAAKSYDVNLVIGPDHPGRVSWSPGPPGGEHGPRETFHASLAPDGALQVTGDGASPVAQFIDVLHQQVGLPFPHEVSMPVVGAIALLYVIAIVSGFVILLPKIVRELFTVRVGSNVKRMWLDVHNVLGVLSLPFHIVMATTSVIFAFHDQFYDAQALAFAPRQEAVSVAAPPADPRPMLAPAQVVERLAAEAPGFTPTTLTYGKRPDGEVTLRVAGTDPRYGLRGPAFGMASLDPHDGQIVADDYMPGKQDAWGATITTFFALHFGSFGGAPIRWAYFFLGIAGAFLFYTGNLLWIESRRRRERKAGAVEQTRATRTLAALTVGVPLGSVAGVAGSLAAAKLFGTALGYGAISMLYYVIFLAMTAWALLRGAARASSELLAAAALSVAGIVLADFTSGQPIALVVDLSAAIFVGGLLICHSRSRRRATDGDRDSVWANGRRALQE